jgi:hypothetical protein
MILRFSKQTRLMAVVHRELVGDVAVTSNVPNDHVAFQQDPPDQQRSVTDGGVLFTAKQGKARSRCCESYLV